MSKRSMIATLVVLACAAQAAPADDVVLTIGGGYAPSGNQVSIERNVHYFREVIDRARPGGDGHTILFADGNDSTRDVVYLAEESPGNRAELLLARVFDEEEYFFERFRNHELLGVKGALSRDNLEQWFTNAARELDGDDRLLIYVTAHGGESSDKRRAYNTKIHLWNHEEITMREFAAQLDRLSPELPVVLVMVQCYSGGFSHVLFEGGNPRSGLAKHNRCGFFATTHDRVAAGCTPAVQEADYREYSSDFWAALTGRTRTGDSLERPDYDGDGRTSLAEAHAYVIIHSDTIDLPVTTTDAFLRVYSDLRPGPRLARGDDEDDEDPEESRALRPTAPLAIDSPIDSLVGAADSVERAVIEALSKQLELASTDRALAAGRLLTQLGDRRKRLVGTARKRQRQADFVRRRIADDVLAQWPELENPWNPEGRRRVREESEQIVRFIESHEAFERWQEARKDQERLTKQAGELELREVKCERLLRMLESVALANNLPLVADEERIRRYLALRKAENGTLGESRE